MMIREPPAAPTEIYNDPSGYSAMMGVIEERGLLPGRIKLIGDGTKPKALVTLGIEKSFISLFMMIPTILLTLRLICRKRDTSLFQGQ